MDAETGVELMYRVIAYTLLCGYSPFRSDDKAELVKETTRGKIVFHERYWRKVSDTGESLNLKRAGLATRRHRRNRLYAVKGADVIAKDFIKGMLVVDPKHRMSAREALDHPVRLSLLPFLPFTPSLLALSSC
jgi:calcium/calmodulin-dependent protein kinase I